MAANPKNKVRELHFRADDVLVCPNCRQALSNDELGQLASQFSAGLAEGNINLDMTLAGIANHWRTANEADQLGDRKNDFPLFARLTEAHSCGAVIEARLFLRDSAYHLTAALP